MPIDQMYWQTVLSGFTEPKVLGIKKTTKPGAGPLYEEETINLQTELDESTERLLLGAYGYLISCYSGNDDIIFGFQTEEGEEPIPVRITIQQNTTVASYLEQLQHQLNESRQNKFVPEDTLFDNIVTFCNLKTKKYSLYTFFSENRVKFIYDANSYEKSAIQQFATHFKEIFNTFIQHPDSDLLTLSLLTKAEQQKILIDWNRTETEYPNQTTIHQLFEEQVVKTPNNVALVYENQSMSYLQLNEKANQLAHHLRELKVKPDTLIGICMERSLDLLVGIYGILKSDAGYVPLDPGYPEDRLEYILENSQATILITESKLAEKFSAFKGHLIVMESIEKEISSLSKLNLEANAKPNNLAYVIYTSGSTGKPKGVMIEHRGAINLLFTLQKKFPVKESDSYILKTSIMFDVSIPELFGWFFEGGRLVISKQGDEKDASRILETIQKNKVSHVNLVPSLAQVWVDSVSNSELNKLKVLKYMIFAGEALLRNLVIVLKEKVHVINAYGPTETVVYSSSFDTLDNFNGNPPIGKPFFNTKVYILDHHMRALPIGIPGELHIGGDCLARGYFNRPDLTAEKFVKNPFNADSLLYKTGDLCRYMPDGNIEYLGRIDFQVKIRGFRIELGEIEAGMATHPKIKEALVLARENQAGEKYLVAYCTLKDAGQTLETTELADYLKGFLPEYMIPSAFVTMSSFPLTSNSKINRKALPEPQISTNRNYRPPTSSWEIKLADLWSEVFQVKPIGLDDNFFGLGGNSLSAMRIIAKIKKSLSKDISIKDLYENPTLAELAPIVNRAKNSSDKEELAKVPYRPLEIIPLSYMQWLMLLTKISTPEDPEDFNIHARKRVNGKLNIDALYFAFNCIFKKHPVITYYLSEEDTLLFSQKNFDFRINEKDIRHLSSEDKESELYSSMKALANKATWEKGFPLIAASLFYLEDNVSELQVSLSHVVFDRISIDVIFSDLSKYYSEYQSGIKSDDRPEAVFQFQDYIIDERKQVEKNLNRDIAFWENYCQDIASVNLISMEQTEYAYSTFMDLTENDREKIEQFCRSNNLNIVHFLGAVCAQVLKKFTKSDEEEKDGKNFFLFFLKAPREQEMYDKTLGQFLDVQFTKISTNKLHSLVEATNLIKQSAVETAEYQGCPAVVRYIVFLNNADKTRSSFFDSILKYISTVFASIYTFFKYGKKHNFNNNLLQFVYSFHFSQLMKTNQRPWLIFINVLDTFLEKNTPEEIFGLKTYKAPNYEELNSSDKNEVFFTFQKDVNTGVYKLVIASNLSSEMKEKLGREVINTIRRGLKP